MKNLYKKYFVFIKYFLTHPKHYFEYIFLNKLDLQFIYYYPLISILFNILELILLTFITLINIYILLNCNNSFLFKILDRLFAIPLIILMIDASIIVVSFFCLIYRLIFKRKSNLYFNNKE